MHVVTILETGPSGTIGALRATLAALEGVPDAAHYEATVSVRGSVKKLECRWVGEPATGDIPMQRGSAEDVRVQ